MAKSKRNERRYIDMSSRQRIMVIEASQQEIIASCEKALRDFKPPVIKVEPFSLDHKSKRKKDLVLAN